jgi:hypothetical protein
MSALILAGSSALLLLSNVATLSVMIYPLLAYLVITISIRRIRSLILFGSLAIVLAFLLSAFWLIPYLQYSRTSFTNLFWIPPTGSYPQQDLISFTSLFTPNFTSLSSGYLGYIILPALAAVLFLRKRQDFGLYAAASVSILLTVGASVTPSFYRIPLVLLLQFPRRFLIADILFLSLLAAIFFDRLFDRIRSMRNRACLHLVGGLKTVAASLIFLVIVLPFVIVPLMTTKLSVPLVSITQEEEEAFTFLSNQPDYFRVMPFDRYHEWFPMFTSKGSVDGWYDQATSTVYRSFTFDLYYASGADVNNTLNGLRLLGVKYIMFYFADGGDAPEHLKIYMSSAMAPPVFMNERIAIFEVPDTRLVYVAGSALLLNVSYQDKASVLAGIVKNPDFSPDGVVVLDGSLESSYPNTSYYQTDSPIQFDPINYNISNLSWSETRISFDLNISRECYILVSSTYFPGWTAEVDGVETKMLQAVPSFSALFVRNAGRHIITLHYQWTLIKMSTIFISGTTLSLLATIVIFRAIRRKQIN